MIDSPPDLVVLTLAPFLVIVGPVLAAVLLEGLLDP